MHFSYVVPTVHVASLHCPSIGRFHCQKSLALGAHHEVVCWSTFTYYNKLSLFRPVRRHRWRNHFALTDQFRRSTKLVDSTAIIFPLFPSIQTQRARQINLHYRGTEREYLLPYKHTIFSGMTILWGTECITVERGASASYANVEYKYADTNMATWHFIYAF